LNNLLDKIKPVLRLCGNPPSVDSAITAAAEGAEDAIIRNDNAPLVTLRQAREAATPDDGGTSAISAQPADLLLEAGTAAVVTSGSLVAAGPSTSVAEGPGMEFHSLPAANLAAKSMEVGKNESFPSGSEHIKSDRHSAEPGDQLLKMWR
jgi:hypothetical protein